jgi:4-amino-4-deoxy-L-arabinose transferase-like glycosyltransferase
VNDAGVPKRTLALLAVGAVAVRLLYLVAFARDYRPRSDAHHYHTIAANFADGDGLSAAFPFTYQHPTAFRPPLYPALLGAFHWVTGDRVGGGQLLNVALGAAVVVLAALLGAHIAGRRGAVAAGAAVAVYPPLVANDVVLLSEPLSLALLLLMILLLVRDRPAWAGLVCGLLVLTRPSAQLLVVVVAAWLVWRQGWRSAVRFGAVTVVVVAPWVVRNWVLVGEPTVVTSNGFNLVSTYSDEAQSTKGFADAVFDDRFTGINLDNRSEVDLDDAYREHAIDDVRDHRTIPLRVVRHNLARYFELRPDVNESAERVDGRNITFRNVTLPLFYIVTVAGLIGLWRARRQRGAELLLVQAAYFTVASVGVIAVPRLRAPLDLAAAIGVGLLVTQLLERRVPVAATPARQSGGSWSRRTRILVTVGVIICVIVAAGGTALARNRVDDNARSQLHSTLETDGQGVQRLAEFDAATLVDGTAPTPSTADFERAQTVADRLWMLSPRLAGGLRSDGRDAARALDQAILELRVLEFVTGGNRAPPVATTPAHALDSARGFYETWVRRTNDQLPDWDTISANATMRRVARDLERLDPQLSS